MGCVHLQGCQETSVKKVLEDYTCIRFEAVDEPVFRAREATLQRYGAVLAVQAMLLKSKISKGEVDE